MNIQYPNHRPVVDGDYLSPMKTANAPMITLSLDNHRLYTLLMFDPDAVGGNLIHWMIVNTETTIFPYLGPHPPPDSGIHHYHFLLIAQDEPIRPVRLRKRQRSIDNLWKSMGIRGNMVMEKYFISSS